MYVSIIGLQLWLLVEMIYCYGKISAAGVAQRESMSVHTHQGWLAINRILIAISTLAWNDQKININDFFDLTLLLLLFFNDL